MVPGTMVVSFFAAPGLAVRYFSDESTIWSIDRPSSRVWIRIRCQPPAGNRIRPPLTLRAPHPSSSHPHSDTPQPEHSSRLNGSAEVVPISHRGLPPPSTAPVNWTKTESLYGELRSALPRIQSL